MAVIIRDAQVNLREVSDQHLPVLKRPVHRGFRSAQGDVEMFGGKTILLSHLIGAVRKDERKDEYCSFTSFCCTA